jgi:predicted HD phosphohydrolase
VGELSDVRAILESLRGVWDEEAVDELDHALQSARQAVRDGERVGWLAGAHVAAKRYLVAADPSYAATLSDVSVDSLHYQGGAGVDAAYTDHPWWPDAVRLRRYDDAAKVPRGAAVSIGDVLAVAERVTARRRW